jgi:hypothetical protein
MHVQILDTFPDRSYDSENMSKTSVVLPLESHIVVSSRAKPHRPLNPSPSVPWGRLFSQGQIQSVYMLGLYRERKRFRPKRPPCTWQRVVRLLWRLESASESVEHRDHGSLLQPNVISVRFVLRYFSWCLTTLFSTLDSPLEQKKGLNKFEH